MKSCLAVILSVSVAFVPVILNAGELAAAEKPITSIAFADTSRADASLTRAASFDVFQRNEQRVIEAKFRDGGAEASLTVNGGVLTFGDGYSLSTEVISDDATQQVVRIVARGGRSLPRHGETPRAVAVVTLNKATHQGDSSGMDRIYRVMRQSSDFNVVAGMLPFLQAQAAGKRSAAALGVGAAPIRSDGWVGCGIAAVELVAAAVGMIVACGAPVVDLLVCLPAIGLFAAAGVNLACECSDDPNC